MKALRNDSIYAALFHINIHTKMLRSRA